MYINEPPKSETVKLYDTVQTEAKNSLSKMFNLWNFVNDENANWNDPGNRMKAIAHDFQKIEEFDKHRDKIVIMLRRAIGSEEYLKYAEFLGNRSFFRTQVWNDLMTFPSGYNSYKDFMAKMESIPHR